MFQFKDISWAWSKQLDLPVESKIDSNELLKQILSAPKVIEAIREVSDSEAISIHVAKSRAKEIFSDMNGDIWQSNIRFLGYVFRKVFRALFEGIHIDKDGIKLIREATKKSPIVLLPNHQSHIDYIVLTYMCFANGLPLPHVVAGDNLLITVIGEFLKHGGALFIRRKFGSDVLYRAIFEEYLACLLRLGGCLECFIEGGRSRVGKVISPKTGFLKILSDLVSGGRVDDVQLVPISLACQFRLNSHPNWSAVFPEGANSRLGVQRRFPG
eukprot:977246_1